MPTALVTGALRGIGRAITEGLLEIGFDVAAIDIDARDAAEAALHELHTPGPTMMYLQHDVAAIDGHAQMVRHVRETLGDIHCLVNNAGVTSLVRGDPLDLTPESFDRCSSVNVRGTFFLTQAVARAMVAAAPHEATHYRSIITITSANAEIIGVDRADYCITKAAASMLSRIFAARLAGSGIHVFEVRPGIIRTRMTKPATAKYDALIEGAGVPIARWGEPRDVATTVATLAQGRIPYATGEVINVGGGLHLGRV